MGSIMGKASILAVMVVFCAATAAAGTLSSATWNGALQGTPFTLTTGGGSLVASGTSTGGSITVSVSVSFSSSGTAPGRRS